MKWKRSFTAEEAALIANGFSEFKSIEQAQKSMSPSELEDVLTLKNELELEIGSLDSLCYQPDSPRGRYIEIADEVHMFNATDLPDNYLDPSKCTMTAESLAVHFWNTYGELGQEVARKFDPSIETKMQTSLKISQNEISDKEPNSKGRNSFLRTIKALSHALKGDEICMPKKDADVIEQTLARNGVKLPVSTRKLQGYFSEALELDQ